jgi:hypothetical protein
MDNLVAIIAIIIMALGAYGFWVAMGEGMILENWRTFLEKHFPVWVQMPLATCPRCMVTILGTACALAALHLPGPFYLIGCIPAAVGLQDLIDR